MHGRALIVAATVAVLCSAGISQETPRGGEGAGSQPGGGSWTETALKIEPAMDFKFRTPGDGLGNHGTVRGNWADVTHGVLPLKGAKGGPMKFESRLANLAVDLDGCGSFCQTVQQDFFAVKALEEDGSLAPYFFRLRRDDKLWFFQRACVATGQIEKTPISFADENDNGRFDDLGADVVRVGNAAGAGFLGRVISVRGKLYEIQVAPSGQKLKYRPYEPKDGAGKLDLFSGYKANSKPSIAIVRKKEGGNLVFDCAQKGGVTVPAGEYELVEALFGPSREVVCVAHAGRMGAIVVKPGETTTPRWGMPGTFDFTVSKDNNTLTIGGVQPYGAGGEVYDTFYPGHMIIHVEVVEEKTRKKVWWGALDHAVGTHLTTNVPWICRLSDETIPYLGPFQSEWK